MASRRPLVLNAGKKELLQSGDSLDIGGYNLPVSGGSEGEILVMGASDAAWGTTTALVLTLGGVNTTGDIVIDSDSSTLQLGADADYTVGWNGSNAVHTISAGAYNFEGGALKPWTVNTTQRDAITPVEGMIVYNSTTKSVEKYEDAVWSAGQYTLPTGGSPEEFLKRTAGGYVWTTTFTSTLSVGAVNTTGNVTIDSDSNGVVLGDDADYSIKHDGANAVHTTTTGAFNFDGGALRFPTFNTSDRDAITPVNGMTIYNSEDAQIQEYEAGSWEHKAPARIIVTDETFYVTTGGDDTTGDGSSGTPWATIDKALAVVGDMVLLADVAINIEKGDYADTDILVFDHPQGCRLNVSGDWFEETLALTSRSGSSPNFVYLFNTTNTSEYTLNDYVVVYDAIGGSVFYAVQGVLEVTAIDPGVSVSLKNFVATPGATGAVTATIRVPQVQWVRKLKFETSLKTLEGIQLQYDPLAEVVYIIDTDPKESITVNMSSSVVIGTNASPYGICRNTKGTHMKFYKSGTWGLHIGWITYSTLDLDWVLFQNGNFGVYGLYGASIEYDSLQFNRIPNCLSIYYESTMHSTIAGDILPAYEYTTLATPAIDTEGNSNSFMGS